MSLSIVEILEKKGSMTDLELQKELKSNFGEGIDEARARRSPLGLPVDEGKETGRAHE